MLSAGGLPAAPLAVAESATQAQVSAAYGRLPLSFEANQGQTDSRVNFLSRGSGYTLFLTPGEAVLSLAAGEANDMVRMRIVGADPHAQAAGLEEQAGRTNYLVGSDPSQWHTAVVNYGRVEYQDVYSGIDVVYYGNQRRLEYDFVVAPGADPNEIRLAFDGVRSMELDAGGNLILHTHGGDLVKDAPVVYQEVDGTRRGIAGRFRLDDGQVRFEVGPYDDALPLVIDPILSYSTYLGGKGNDYGYGIAVDGAGNAYITGYTVATSFPTKNPLQPANLGGRSDAFVTKLNSTGTGLVYSTYLGGSDDDWGLGIALDTSGDANVTGWTRSANFPTTVNAFDATLGGAYDAFVAKLNSSGSALLYSTYLGGSGSEEGHGIAVDGFDKAYVTGWTGATGTVSDFPTTQGAFQTARGGRLDAFVTKLDTTATTGPTSLAYSTYLGGAAADDWAYGIAVDNSGSAYVTGVTISSDFPLAGLQPLQAVHGGGLRDAFVTKVNATGSALDFSTYLGGNGDDVGHAIALDRNTGEAYVLGSTYSANFPVANAYQPAYAGSGDAFVSRLSATGSLLLYSTYLGGSRWDGGNSLNTHAGIAVDVAYNAYVTGFTQSTNFPTKNPLPGQGVLQSTDDAFVTKIDTAGAGTASLVFSTYLGGNDAEEGFAVAVDGAGNVYVAGETQSTKNFPVTTGAFQSRKTKGDDVHVTDAFVTMISTGAAPLSIPSAPAGGRQAPVAQDQTWPTAVDQYFTSEQARVASALSTSDTSGGSVKRKR